MAEKTEIDRTSAPEEDMDLLGEFRHNLDQRNRVAIPAKLREALGESFILFMARNGDHCLFGYKRSDWKRLMENVNRDAPSYELTLRQRMIYMNAEAVELDSKGRITIPQRFLKGTGISDEVVIFGAGQRVEFWSVERWEEMVAKCADLDDETGVVHLAF